MRRALPLLIRFGACEQHLQPFLVGVGQRELGLEIGDQLAALTIAGGQRPFVLFGQLPLGIGADRGSIRFEPAPVGLLAREGIEQSALFGDGVRVPTFRLCKRLTVAVVLPGGFRARFGKRPLQLSPCRIVLAGHTTQFGRQFLHQLADTGAIGKHLGMLDAQAFEGTPIPLVRLRLFAGGLGFGHLRFEIGNQGDGTLGLGGGRSL
jgi:hypothetical protein